jgi:hypothetical protein
LNLGLEEVVVVSPGLLSLAVSLGFDLAIEAARKENKYSVLVSILINLTKTKS